MDFIPSERATPIRVPSTANLMVDSADRNQSELSAWDFQISKSNSIMNGFFTRIGTTEVVLEWCENNIRADLSNNWAKINVSGTDYLVTIPDGAYTTERCLQYLGSAFNDISGSTGKGCTAGSLLFGGFSGLLFTPTTPKIFMLESPLINNLDMKVFTNSVPGNAGGLDISGSFFFPSCPDLRLYRYIDIVSPQLTYNQDLKDNSTAPIVRDVLVRWYFDDDVPEQLDGFGFPILMGYTRFCRRRIYNPPKQIKWDSRQPLGNIAFQVYDDNGNLLPVSDSKTNWLMTLQMSEV